MQEFIVSETNKIFKKAIKNFAQKEKVDESEVSLLLTLSKDESRNVIYKVCVHHVPKYEVGILQVLGVRIDLKGYSLLVPPQIKKILEGFEQQRDSKEIDVCIYLSRDEDADDVWYYLFDGGKLVQQFALVDVLKIE
jgi:hypothetical protein